MTELEALKELAEKVKAGDKNYYPASDYHLATGGKAYETPKSDALAVERAYHGSLDAAKKLHDAVLPGFYWDATNIIREGVRAHVYFVRNGWNCQHSEHQDPARAWLIAIIEAKIAELEG